MKWVPSIFRYFETSWIQKCVATFEVCNWVATGAVAKLLFHAIWLQIAFHDSLIPRLDIPRLTSMYQWPKTGSETGSGIKTIAHLDEILLEFFIGQFWILVMNDQYHIENSKEVKLHKFLAFTFHFGQKFSRLCQTFWWCLKNKMSCSIFGQSKLF